MTCRTTRLGSAITSYARLTSGLEDQQTLSTYHEMLREGRNQPAPSAEALNQFIDTQIAAVRANTDLSDARRRSLINRLEEARTQQIDGRTFYGASRMYERTTRARTALGTYYDDLARDLGVSRTEVEADVAAAIRRADEGGRSANAPAAWRQEFGERSENRNLPLDRQTAYALHQMEQRRAATRAAAPTRRTVTRVPVNSTAVASVGYDPQTGRLEVEMHSRLDEPYSYRVPQDVYDEMMASRSIGGFYATRIRNNRDFQYATAADQSAAGTQQQCATCGQWAGAGHTCPVRDSQEERNRTERLARERARATRNTTPALASLDSDEARVREFERQGMSRSDAQATVEAEDILARERAATPAAPVRREPVRLGRSTWRDYHGDSGSFRSPSLTNVQQEARQHGAVSVEITAGTSRFSTPTGYGWVYGRVNVEYLGRGRGYRVTPVTEPGDSGNDRLRCNCPDYRANYDCEHVRQAVANINARINQDRLRERHRAVIAAATQTVAADLARDRAESISAQETSQTTWGEAEVSYSDDMEAFQRDYKAAKERIAAGQPAVEYMTENATDGLGALGTGRGFGVEIEFDLGPNAGYDARSRIGQELYEAGLTRSASQAGYHDGLRRGYTTNHRGGWSFESDCTVSGEVVSPIMYDTPETWENLRKVCEIVKRNGGVATVRTGSHVHVSAGNYDHSVGNHNRLMATFRENEDTIYRLSANPERGTHRGPSWCRPNNVPASGYQNVDNARYSNNGHHMGVNMQSVSGRESDHIEFRTFDGTIDHRVIQTQVKVALAMTEAAFRDTDHQPTASEPLGSRRSHNRQQHGAARRLTGEAWREDTKSFRLFADRLFRRESDKAQLASLFAATKWQTRGTRGA